MIVKSNITILIFFNKITPTLKGIKELNLNRINFDYKFIFEQKKKKNLF
jgi:hypothetical protein